MLTIEVTLLHGTIRAGSAQDLALTGREDPGEWPPSPARVFAALVAGDGTRDRCRVTDGSELAMLEAAPPPRIHADPHHEVLCSASMPRYVVVDGRAGGAVQEYVGRTSTEVRPGPRLAPRNALIAYVWDDLELEPDHLRALGARAARVGYLGCADSPARLRVSAGEIGEQIPTTVWQPDAVRGEHPLPVPFPGLVEVLDAAYDAFSAGQPVRRSWYRTVQTRYRSPDTAVEDEVQSPTVLWLRFERPVSGRKVLAVTETLKEAVLDLYQRHAVTGQDGVPAVLRGHGLDGTGSQHAHWLALPDVGHPHARGRIHGAAVWLPPGTETTIVEGVRTALWHLRVLTKPNWFETSVRPYGGENRPLAAHPRRWSRPARRWVSVFPVVHERWTGRNGPSLAEVATWCVHAGIDTPLAGMRSARPPLQRGAPSLHPREVHRDGRPRHPFSHMELVFAKTVPGPVMIGSGRQFGLGLFLPVRDETPSAEDGNG